MSGKLDRPQTETPHARPHAAVGSRHEAKPFTDLVKESDAELHLALERWEDEGGAFVYRSISTEKGQPT